MRLLLDNLTVKRGERVVLSQLSCQLDAGQALVLTGPNGAGKTTLIRTIAGFIQPASGRIALEGADPELDIAQLAHHAGHTNAIKAAFTVAENLRFWASFLGDAEHGSIDQRIDGALREFGLKPLAHIQTAYLSAGQKRRAGLARLLVAKRPLWLLDEPTASLDHASAETVARLINAHTAEGGLAVIATHLPMPLDRTVSLDLGALARGAAA